MDRIALDVHDFVTLFFPRISSKPHFPIGGWREVWSGALCVA